MPQMSVLSVKLYFLMYIMLANIPKLGTIIIMAVDIRAFLSFYFLSHEPTEQIESYALYWSLEMLENQFTLLTTFQVEIARVKLCKNNEIFNVARDIFWP